MAEKKMMWSIRVDPADRAQWSAYAAQLGIATSVFARTVINQSLELSPAEWLERYAQADE